MAERSRRRDRRTAPARESKRAALVAAAYEQLAREGFEGLRTRAVAGAVGVNVATLHYYFPTKETLVRGVVGHALGRFRSTLPRSGAAAEQLRAHFRGVRRLAREEPELFAVMGELSLRARRDPSVAAIIRDTDKFWHVSLRELLRRARMDRAIAAGTNEDDLAGLIIVALKGTFMVPAAPRDTRGLDRTLRQLKRFLAFTP